MILTILPCAILFRIRGGGIIDQEKYHVPRWVYILGMGILIALTAETWLYAAAMGLVSIIMGCLPTKMLLDMTHPQARFSEALGIGMGRALYCMPAAFVNPWVLLLLFHGLVYYYAGRSNLPKPVTISELIIGAFIGALL